MKKRIKLVAFAMVLVIAACAVITVNVYFPEKDVKEAFKTLEDDLMLPGQKGEEQPATKPEGTTKPESFLHLELVSAAYAQDSDITQKIADTVKKMPDVVAAYREIGAVLPDLDRLRSSGVIGEANNGLLVQREGSLNPADRQLVDMVNKNRKIVIHGMAKAIVRINRQPENPDTLKQVTSQATEQFAAHRADTATKGWWVQDANGNWGRK